MLSALNAHATSHVQHCRDAELNGEEHEPVPVQDYTLVGVTVHSGQAAGGHYYSFIRHRETGKWLRFDDSDVTPYELTEARMRKDFFGGSYALPTKRITSRCVLAVLCDAATIRMRARAHTHTHTHTAS
jgi:ubiquitin C-terminal hydrolase